MRFSDTLKGLREKNGYTQQRLSELLHVSKNSISHYELGKNMPDINILVEMTDIFDVSLDYLLGLTDFNLSKDLLNKSFDKTLKVGSVIEVILRLDKEHKSDMLRLLRYIERDNRNRRNTL